MVEQPQRVQPGHLGHAALLPVQPPEVHALLLEGVVQLLEVGLDEVGVGRVEAHRQPRPGVEPHPLRDRLVRRLVGVHPLGRVHVEGGGEPALPQRGEEAGRVREEVGVPGVAGPAAAVRGVDVDPVPVHVDDRDRERHPLLAEPVDQRDVLVGGVGVVAAPPVAEGVARQQGRGAGQVVEGAEGLLVVVAVGEHVQVEVALGARGDPAVVAQQHRAGVVDRRDPVEGQHAVLERQRPVDVVEGAGGAAEVRGGQAVAPHRAVGVVAALGLHREAVGAERALVVDQVEPVGVDLQERVGLGDREVAGPEGPVQHHLRGAVLEHPRGAVLEAHEAGVEHGDPVPVALHDVRGVRDRMRVESEVLLHRVSSQTLPMTWVIAMRSATRSGFSRG